MARQAGCAADNEVQADTADVASVDTAIGDVGSNTDAATADVAASDAVDVAVVDDTGGSPADTTTDTATDTADSNVDAVVPTANTWAFKGKTYSSPGITCPEAAHTQNGIQSVAGNIIQCTVTLPPNPTSGPKTCKKDKTTIGPNEIVIELNNAPKMANFWTCQGGTVDLVVDGAGKVTSAWSNISMLSILGDTDSTFSGKLVCP